MLHCPYIRIGLALIITAFFFSVKGQNSAETDSLFQLLSKSAEDTNKVRILHQLVKAHEYTDFEKAIELANQQYELSKKLDYQWGIGKAELNLGFQDMVQGNYDEALAHYLNSSAAAEICQDPILLVDAASSTGQAYMRKNRPSEAIKYYHQSLKLSEQFEDTWGIATAYSDLAILHQEYKDNTRALEYNLKALETFRSINEKDRIALQLVNIGIIFQETEEYDKAIENIEEATVIYKDLGYDYFLATNEMLLGLINRKKGLYEQAEAHFDAAEPMLEKFKDVSALGDVQHYRGTAAFEQGNYEAALRHYQKSLELKREINNIRGTIMNLNSLARTHLALKNYSAAENFILQSKAQSDENTALSNRRETAEILYMVNKEKGNYPEALKYLEEYGQIKDSLLNEERAQMLAILQADFETTQREQRLQLLNSQNQVQQLTLQRRNRERVYLLIFLGALLLLAGLLYNRYRLKAKTQKKLEELDALKSRFFTNVSHEFRTPLSLIIGPLETQLQKAEKEEDQEELEMMHRNAHRISRLIDQLMDLSKIEAGSLKLEVVEADVVSFLRPLVSAFQSHAEYRNIEFSFDLPDREILGTFDPDKLEKILYNLISNAFKYTPEGGTVEIKAKARQDQLDFEVADSGPGISADQLPHIFERFYRISDERQWQEGSGIGLALTKELVELHGGSISVESHVGKGSIFRFSLPLAASIYRDAVRLESYPVAMQKVSSPKVLDTVPVSNILDQPLVLLIDDNADIRQFIKKQLQAQFQIIDAADGQEGLQKAIDTVPDLIISDLMMPKMDGMEFCQKVRDDQRTAHIPVIMLTARADMGSKLEGLEKGADAYLTKPFNAEELRIRVRKMIEQRQKLRDQFAAILKLETTNIQLDSLDEQFIKNAIEIVEAQIDNPDFTVEAFQKVLGMSKTQLHRKLKALTDQSASEFIRTLRIKRAAQYLKQKSHTVSEAAYSVGFNNLSYFAKCFREQFGKTPSQYP